MSLNINFNIGLLGHVDSGKTTLARALSTTASTAAFDKSPQSQERQITLDLGFSAFTTAIPEHLRDAVLETHQQQPQMQFTFVDCPGHASLIRTIISGAQIIDLMILVIDAQKGIQTQTAECIVIGEILQRELIVVVNKIDLLDEVTRTSKLQQLHIRLRKTLARTAFGSDVPICNVCANDENDIQTLRERICKLAYIPTRNINAPLLIYVDHCFAIKGQGTVCTGTVMQGRVTLNDNIEIPAIGLQRKVKSIQMFRQPAVTALMGDRIGLCVTQFNPKLLERGLLTQPQYLQCIYAACICVRRIQYYKLAIKSGGKFHFTVAHKTVTGTIILFHRTDGDRTTTAAAIFDPQREYEYVEALNENETIEHDNKMIFALLEFDVPIYAAPHAIVIASNLDMDVNRNQCRLAFWGQLDWWTHNSNYVSIELPKFKIFKWKLKQGTIARVIDKQNVIVQNLFGKVSNREQYVGKRIQLSTGETGIIESCFGQTSKVKIYFQNELNAATLNQLTSDGVSVGNRNAGVIVQLHMKKYIYNKGTGLVQ